LKTQTGKVKYVPEIIRRKRLFYAVDTAVFAAGPFTCKTIGNISIKKLLPFAGNFHT
jgi:hypothetical protein